MPKAVVAITTLNAEIVEVKESTILFFTTGSVILVYISTILNGDLSTGTSVRYKRLLSRYL